MHPHGRGPTDGGCPPPLIPGGIFSMEGPEIPANKAGNWEVRGIGWLMAAGCLEVSTGPRGRKEQARVPFITESPATCPFPCCTGTDPHPEGSLDSVIQKDSGKKMEEYGDRRHIFQNGTLISGYSLFRDVGQGNRYDPVPAVCQVDRSSDNDRADNSHPAPDSLPGNLPSGFRIQNIQTVLSRNVKTMMGIGRSGSGGRNPFSSPDEISVQEVPGFIVSIDR